MPTSRLSTAARFPIAAALACVALLACGGGGGGEMPPGRLPIFDSAAVAAADPGSTLPAAWRQGVFAEIFVRAYKDSDGDGIGDLRGLTQSLDYLKDLGVSGIWLMPVTPSEDHDHGYAVTDYRAIETAYGSLADFDELLAQAHARGIGVVVDYVMNHSAALHPAFVNAQSVPSNAYRDWYLFQPGHPSGWSIYGGDPWRASGSFSYFAPFWDQMPDFNLRNAGVVAFHHDNLRFWLNRGVDGFRFDAVGNLFENGPNAWLDQPENYVLMNGVRELVSGYAQRFLVCEAPDDPTGFAAPTACGTAFAFGHQSDIVNAAKGNAGAIQAVANYFANAPLSMATLVSNHDSFAGDRLWNQVNGNLAQYKLAAATYLLQPGTPIIYYGEEIGMAGAASLSGDPKLRTPMSWTANASGFTSGAPFRALSANVATNNVAAQSLDASSLLGFYKSLIALRKSLPSLTSGTYEAASASAALLTFQRVAGNERAIVVINYGGSATTASVPGLTANAALSDVYPGGADVLTNASGTAAISAPAQSVRVLVLRS